MHCIQEAEAAKKAKEKKEAEAKKKKVRKFVDTTRLSSIVYLQVHLW